MYSQCQLSRRFRFLVSSVLCSYLHRLGLVFVHSFIHSQDPRVKVTVKIRTRKMAKEQRSENQRVNEGMRMRRTRYTIHHRDPASHSAVPSLPTTASSRHHPSYFRSASRSERMSGRNVGVTTWVRGISITGYEDPKEWVISVKDLCPYLLLHLYTFLRS